MRYVDLSHTIYDGLITYKGLPAPLVCDFLSREQSQAQYADDSTFQIGQITMVGNTGTYMDCPFHRYEDGKDFAQLFVSDLADLPGLAVDVPYSDGLAIDVARLPSAGIDGHAVLLRTGWSKHWNTDAYYENHPYLTEQAAAYLLEQGVKLVGIDGYNLDDTRIASRPAHRILLAQDVPIVEHLCQLHLIPSEGFTFTAVPPKVQGMGSWPVRAYAKF